MKKQSRKKPKTSLNPYHHGDLRNALIQASLTILESEGAHSLSLREAARKAGVSQAAPYRHFSSKESLVAAIAQDGFVQLIQCIEQSTLASDPRLRLEQAVLAYLRFAIDHSEHYRVMFNASPPIRPGEYPELDRANEDLFFLLGKLAAPDLRQNSLALWSGIHGLSAFFINHRLDSLKLSRHDVEDAARLLALSLSAPSTS